MSLKKNFAIVVAVDKQTNGIGNAGQLVWQIPRDLQHFRALTIGHIVIMGRKTFASLKQPLANRINIVISTVLKEGWSEGNWNVWVVSSFEKALEKADEMQGKIFVIGGEQIYRLALQHPQCSAVHLTAIEMQNECENQQPQQLFDTFFPEMTAGLFVCVERSSPQRHEQYSFCFETYLRQQTK